MSERPKSLLELLTRYKVEIPIVQRDYAQGRNSEHAKNVRANLLRDMKKAILEENPIDLNFVYGKVENNKFIPVDGQQRLTTLFFLHLYAFRSDALKTSILHNFTYETRITSREFIKRLIENREAVFIDGVRPSFEIKDSEWFVSSWKYDPTIQSALVMLDDIEREFCDVDVLARKLSDVNNPLVTFQFLDMQDLGMEDSLYIKLNARGKPLTDFENFKAQLLGRMKALKLSWIDQFESKFDCQWTDLFWSRYKQDFDKTFYAFFGVLLMNYGVIQEDKKWANTLEYDQIQEEIFFAAYDTLNYVCQNADDPQITTLIFDALNDSRTYTSRVLFHAIPTYLLETKDKADKDLMLAWIRVIKNLALNSEIDNAERYRRAIESISDLSKNCNEIIPFLANKGKIARFNQQQIEEEQIKASIIAGDPDFAVEIFKAEQHQYFQGQIRSALYLAKNEDGTYNKERFDQYWEKICALFDPANPSGPRYGNLLRQALLTFGDYTLPVSQFKTLCVDDPNETARTPSLKALFSQCGHTTKKLLDSINVEEDIENQLKQMAANSGISGNDWRYCFIHYPQLFRMMSVSHLRLRYLNGEMHIIPNKWANGHNYGLFLSALHAELTNRKISSQFDDELGTSAQHYLLTKNCEIFFSKGKFTVVDREKGNLLFTSQTDQPILETAEFIAK